MEKNGQVTINMGIFEKNAENADRHARNIELAEEDAEPLVPKDTTKPPIAHPEHDSDEGPDDDVPFTPDARPGIDDGFFPPGTDIPPPFPENPDTELSPEEPNGIVPRGPGGDETDSDRPGQPFPFAPEFGPNVINVNGVPTIVPDVNEYQHKKTLAQGMMDLALLSANANQLRYVLESYKRHPYYYASLIFIVMSLVFQIAVGVGLILNSRYNVKDKKEICKANRINNFTIIGIFIVTIVNVFISAFGVADPPPEMRA